MSFISQIKSFISINVHDILQILQRKKQGFKDLVNQLDLRIKLLNIGQFKLFSLISCRIQHSVKAAITSVPGGGPNHTQQVSVLSIGMDSDHSAFIHSFLHSFIPPLIHSSTHSFLHSFIPSFIHGDFIPPKFTMEKVIAESLVKAGNIFSYNLLFLCLDVSWQNPFDPGSSLSSSLITQLTLFMKILTKLPFSCIGMTCKNHLLIKFSLIMIKFTMLTLNSTICPSGAI